MPPPQVCVFCFYFASLPSLHFKARDVKIVWASLLPFPPPPQRGKGLWQGAK